MYIHDDNFHHRRESARVDDRTTLSGDLFAGRLLRGEKIVWRGRPRQGAMLTARDVFLIPFSLIWGGFAIFWEANVLRMPNAPAMMALFGAPFALVALFAVFGRFYFDAWIRAQVFYALTDRRVLILRTRPTTNFQSINLDRLPEANLSETSDGRGTIRFGPSASIWNTRGARGFAMWTPSLDPIPQFIAIDDVRMVFALVQDRAQTGFSGAGV